MINIIKGERSEAITRVVTSVILGLAVAIFSIPLSLPLSILIEYGFTADNWSWILDYFRTLIPESDYWLSQYGAWIKKSGFLPNELLGGILLGFATAIIGIATNPYSFDYHNKGAGRIANDRDIAKTGLLEGSIMILGRWKKKFLMLPETLSVLCVAPPGTGKTTGIVVPTIIGTKNTSMIVNDVKPELFDITSGFKSQEAICLKLEWSARDKPEEGLYFPRWNPLSPLSMPPKGAQRDLYIDRLVTIIVPEAQGSADPHWTLKARSTLSGFIHFLTSKCESGNYENIPDQWFGEEPSLPMLLDWFTEAQLNSSDEIEKMREEDPNMALFADPIKNFLMAAVKEAREYGYSDRSVLELTQLANTPDKERGSILSTMDSGLTIFKNAAVRARTSKSDFAFADVRGMKDPETGEMKPVCIFICVNQEDSKALGVITGLFVEALSAWLVAHKPGGTDKDGKKVGPFSTLFVLDEFPQMPKLDALINGPAVGRGQKVSYLMIGQDLGQIAQTYGKDNLETIFSTTAAKVVLPLNNEQTAERFVKMIGKKTFVAGSWSVTEGLGADVNPFKKNMSYSKKEDDVVRTDELMGMPRGTHFVLYQGHMHKPIKATTPYYFEDKAFKDKVDPGNGGKFESAPPMPAWMIQRRVEEEKQRAEFLKFSQGGTAGSPSMDSPTPDEQNHSNHTGLPEEDPVGTIERN